MERISVVHIVDSDPAARDSVELLVKSAGWQPRSYGSTEEFLQAVDAHRPACVVTEAGMPGKGGLDVLKQLPERGIYLPVIITSDNANVTMAVQAFRAGAVDFIEKPFDGQVLIPRVQECLDASEAPMQNFCVGKAYLSRLTCREREVVRLLLSGKTNKAVAAALGISARTVEVHRARIMKKLGAQSLAHLVLTCLEPEGQ